MLNLTANLTETAIRLYRQLFGSPERIGQLADGVDTVLDGRTAVAITEACFSEVLTFGGEFLTQTSVLAWLSEQERVTSNLFDDALSVQKADSPRGALASAIGVSLSGHRSSIFLTAQDILSTQDLLQSAVARHVPLVIHLDNTLCAQHSSSMHSGHEALQQAMDSGCLVLFAANVQEAVDFTLIARHVAELSLTPALVVMDGAETAWSAQDVRLPSAELIRQFIARADELIELPNTVQKQLFSYRATDKDVTIEQRPRVPKWHDLDRPVLQGAMQDAKIFALGHAAKTVYFDEFVRSVLTQAFSDYARLTARQYASVSSYDSNNIATKNNSNKETLKKADIIFVAQGSAIETLNACRLYLQKLTKKNTSEIGKVNIGIIALHSLRPINTEQLGDLLSCNQYLKQPIIVLERMTSALSDDAPLIRELRATLGRYAEQKQLTKVPQLRSIVYGLGGSELNIADIWALLDELKTDKLQISHSQKSQPQRKGQYLGIPFISYDVNNARSKTKEYHPKRQVMLDTLERYYPHISQLGINAKGKQYALYSPQTASLGFAISYLANSDAPISYAMDLGAYLYQLKQGSIRSLIASSWSQYATRQIDFISHAQNAYAVGHASPVNFFLLLSADAQSLLTACQSLDEQGVLIISGNDFSCFSGEAKTKAKLLDSLSIIKDKGLTIYHLNESKEDDTIEHQLSPTLVWEKMLALLVASLTQKEQLNLKTRKIVSLREAMHHDRAIEQYEAQEVFKSTLSLVMDKLTAYNIDAVIYKALENSVLFDNEQAFDIPEMVKNFGQANQSYDSLPRFWDQVGVLQQQGDMEQLTADPYLATGTMPSLSATFHSINTDHSARGLPLFQANSCTACGECWSNCPESAIATLAIHPKALLETGIKIAQADALRAVSSKLAAQIAKECRNAIRSDDFSISNSADLLTSAFAAFKEKANMPQERMQNIEQDFIKTRDALADLPIVASDILFTQPEAKQNDSGELFSLIINPDSCKACGLCVELCRAQVSVTQDEDSEIQPISALTHNLQDSQRTNEQVVAYKKQWQIWQKTPDTASATIERLLHEQSLSAGSALMLSRYNAFALSGGDSGELASGEKIAMRQLLSATEYHQQPLLHLFIADLERLREELKGEIKSSLSAALPTDDLQQLADKLSDVKTRQIDLNSLLDQDAPVMDNSSIDALRVRHLVKLVLAINDLHWKLSQGLYGIGRARYSLCITSSSIASWAGHFPYNPFHVPVVIDVSGESVQMATGLMQGHIHDLLLAVSVMRQAKASIDSRYAKETAKLAQLSWSDLSHEEQQLCPPLFLIGGDDLLGSHGFSQIASVLNSNYPIKVIIFNELDAGLSTQNASSYASNHRWDSGNNLAMMAMSQKNAYVAQTSIADNNHFQQSVQQLLSNNSAGLLSIHTPSPQRHGFKPEQTLQQAELAVNSGMFPLFQYNPQDEGVFGSRLTLHDVIAQKKLDTTNTSELNPIHWAMNEQRFSRHFSELAVNTIAPVELSSWLLLNASEQTKKTPFVTLIDEQENETKWVLSKDFARMMFEQQSIWRTLQELAGIETPFTDYVEHCVAQRLSSEHQAELAALRAQYEAKLQQLEDNYASQTHAKIRNQLLGLAGYDASKLN